METEQIVALILEILTFVGGSSSSTFSLLALKAI